MLGFGQNESLTEYLRLYIALHGDHEGGNASAHTSRMFRTYGQERISFRSRPSWFDVVRSLPFLLGCIICPRWTSPWVRLCVLRNEI